MITKKIMCPHDGIWYYAIPGFKHSDPPVCPVCGGVAIMGGGIHDGTAGTEDLWVHKEIERTFLTDEEAMDIFKKYVKKKFKDFGYKKIGREFFGFAWDSQYWNHDIKGISGNRRDWMEDDFVLACEWYLDGVGRNLGDYHGRAKGLISEKQMKFYEKELNKMGEDLRNKKQKRYNKAKKKREEKIKARGEDFIKNMKVGEVYLLKFNSIWRNRPLLIEEIGENCVHGFYLDRVCNEVLNDSPEKEGYFYTKPDSINIWPDPFTSYNDIKKGKLEWDGKTVEKTRSYVSKESKFIIEKLTNVKII